LGQYHDFKRSVNTGGPVLLLVTKDNSKTSDDIATAFDLFAINLKHYAKFYQIRAKDIPPEFMAERGITAPTILMYSYGLEENRVDSPETSSLGILFSDYINSYLADDEFESDKPRQRSENG
jgi:hypothetical protein